MAQTFSYPNYGLFNATYYLQQNPDVAAGWTGTPLQHYIQFGALEGRAPAAWFDFDFYRSENDDLQSMNALQLFNHYCNYGYSEGRVPMSNFENFNAARYLADNPDVAAAGYTTANAVSHFVEYGETEGRVGYNTSGQVIPSVTNPPVPVQNIALTTGIDTVDITGLQADNITGLTQDDTVAGTVVETFNTGDVVNGNGATTVSLVANGNSAAAPTVDLNDIASVNVNLAADSDINASEFTNVDAVNITKGVTGQTLTITGAQLETTYGISSGRQSSLTIDDWNDAVTGTADAINLNLGGAGTSTLRAAINVAAGVETFNIATSGTNRVSIQSNPAAGTTETSYVVTGSGSNNVQFLAAEVGTYDFSATTGTNTIDLGANLTKDDVVKGGSGKDTLSIAPGGNISGRLQVSGVEALTLSASKASSAGFGDVTGITTVNLTAAADNNDRVFTANQLTGVDTINITGLEANAAGANDVNGLTVGGAASTTVNVNTTADVIDAAGLLTLTGVTGLTYAVTGDADNFSAKLGGVTATGLTSLTVTTAGFDAAADEVNLTLGTVTASGKTISTVDFSGADTGVSVAFADTSLADSAVVTGGTGNDTISAALVSLSAASKKITIIGGEGADTMTAIGDTALDGSTVFQIAQGDSGITATTIDSILGFVSTETTGDYLKLGVAGDATETTGNYATEAATADLTFAAALAAANVLFADLAKTTQYSQIYALQIDTTKDVAWLFTDYNLDGTADQALQIAVIAGVNDFSAANIIA